MNFSFFIIPVISALFVGAVSVHGIELQKQCIKKANKSFSKGKENIRKKHRQNMKICLSIPGKTRKECGWVRKKTRKAESENQIKLSNDLKNCCMDDKGIAKALAMYFDDPDAAEKQNGVIGSWLTCKVTDLTGYNEVDEYYGTYHLFGDQREFNQDINGWDLSSVTSLQQTFLENCDFNQNLNGWDVSSVTSLFSTFGLAISFNSRLSDWDVSSVMTFKFCFIAAESFNQCLDWSIKAGADTTRMFDGSEGQLYC